MRGELKKRGQSWFARIYTGRDETGRRRYVSKTFGVKKDAEQWITRTARDKDQGIVVVASMMTVAEYLKKWLETAAKGRVKEKTFDGYQSIVETHVVPKIGHRSLSKLNALDVQLLFNGMSASGLSPRTLQYTRMILRQALKQAIAWRMLTFNACEGAEVPRQVRREMSVFTPDHVRRFLAVAAFQERQWHALFSVAVTSGMRPSEYLALKWSDIDIERRIVSVQRSLDYNEAAGTWAFSDNKTNRSRRTIKLHGDVVEGLKIHRAKQAEQRKKAATDWNDLDLIFCTRGGNPLQRSNVTRAFQALTKKVNEGVEDPRKKLPRLRLYDLRHTAATLGLAAGVPVKVISEQLGHSSVALTLDVYSHVLPHMQDDAADRVEALLRGQLESAQSMDRRTISAQAPLEADGKPS